jgi:hypothetical protein
VKKQMTNRGFSKIVFTDTYNNQCCIQQSSLATGNHIWLGVESADPRIMVSDALKLGLSVPKGKVMGWMEYPIPKEVFLTTTMHLNRKQVKALVKELSQWLESGDFNEH